MYSAEEDGIFTKYSEAPLPAAVWCQYPGNVTYDTSFTAHRFFDQALQQQDVDLMYLVFAYVVELFLVRRAGVPYPAEEWLGHTRQLCPRQQKVAAPSPHPDQDARTGRAIAVAK